MTSNWKSTAYVKRTNAANLGASQRLHKAEVAIQKTKPSETIQVKREFGQDDKPDRRMVVMYPESSEEVGAAAAAEGGRVGGRSQGKLVNVSPKKNESSAKTPLSLLHEVASKSNAKVTFPEEEDMKCSKTGQVIFQCVVRVVTSFGQVYEGTGVGTSKQNAKHAAARNVLLQLDPKSESYLTPDSGLPVDPDQCHRSGSTITPVFSKEQVLRRADPRGHERKMALFGVVPKTEKDEGEQNINVYEEDDRILIEVKKPPSSSGNLQKRSVHSAVRDISLKEKLELVRGWNGPKVQKLKSYPEEAIVAIKNPFAIARKIAEEQNLNLDFVVFQDKNVDGYLNETYSCFIEVTPEVSSSQDQSSSSFFTAFGFGDSEEEAKMFAGVQFLKMIRMIINS